MASPDEIQQSVDETILQQFESAWLSGHPKPIEELLPPADSASFLSTLEELVHIDMEFHWKAWAKDLPHRETAALGETMQTPARTEEYLARFPHLDNPEITMRLLKQEFYMRCRFADPPSVDEYQQRFPHLDLSGDDFGNGHQLLSRASDDELQAALLPTTPVPEVEADHYRDYQLLEKIGSGGMGIVYRARQKSADRIVALKVIREDQLARLHEDSRRRALERFRTEALTTARLEHDGVVSVFEVGEANGKRFYSMQFVDGPSLAELLREGPLDPRRSAEYVEMVSRAVQAAHDAGILHRDLKPQNVILDQARDRAMVADFGLAKLMEGTAELTRPGEVMGTPCYMPPEQAQDAAQVAETSDVYSLGATLYHLLTARPPFQAASPVETIRQVNDDEPVSPRLLNPAIDRDLETITLKCLQKQPQQRYASAADLADDLDRFLQGRPIAARPVSRTERSIRWCKRNPVVAGALATTAAAILFAIGALAWGLVSTRDALAKADHSYSVANDARAKAEKGYTTAHDVINDQYVEVSESILLDQPGMQPLRERLLKRTLVYYERFLDDWSDDPSLRQELGLTHYRVGRILIDVDTPTAALESYQEARDIQQRLVAASPESKDRQSELATTINAMGIAYRRLGQLGDAMDAFREAEEIRAELHRLYPDDEEIHRTLANSHMNIGIIQRLQGQPDVAAKEMLEAQNMRTELLASAPDNRQVIRDSAMGHYNLAVLDLNGNLGRAVQSLDQAIALFQQLLEIEPRDFNNQHRLAICYRMLGQLGSFTAELIATKSSGADVRAKREEALRAYESGFEVISPLAEQNPDVGPYQSERAALLLGMADLQLVQGYLQNAEQTFQQAVQLLHQQLESGEPELHRDFAAALRGLAEVQVALQKRSAAMKNLEFARDCLEEILKSQPENAEWQLDLDNTLKRLQELSVNP